MTTSARSSRFYCPELDTLRFVAFLMVFEFHTLNRYTSGKNILVGAGSFGVCLFFLLSSFLITELLEREVERTGNVHLSSFYIRRVLRIWPLYFFAIFVARMIDFHAPHLQMSNARLLSMLLLAGNWYIFLYDYSASFALILWSVSIEEQFYVFWPSIRKWMGKKTLFFASIATIGVSYFAIYQLCSSGHYAYQLWVNTFVQMQYFGAGAILSMVLAGRIPQWKWPVRIVLFLAAAACFIQAGRVWQTTSFKPAAVPEMMQYAFVLSGAILLFLASYGFAAMGKSAVLRHLGKISFGLYVWHLLALNIVNHLFQISRGSFQPSLPVEAVGHVILGLGLTILMAHLSYRYLETPFLRLKDRFTFVKSRAV